MLLITINNCFMSGLQVLWCSLYLG